MDWYEEGRGHRKAVTDNPDKAKPNYPTQDIYSAADEAEFLRGYADMEREEATLRVMRDAGYGD